MQIRHMNVQGMRDVLDAERRAALDVVSPAQALRSERGQLIVPGTGEATITESGVTASAGSFRPNEVAVDGLADKLSIPSPYLRRLAAVHPPLFDANVNGWLEGDRRKFLLRLRRDASGAGTLRAVLSDSYGIVDNYDVFMAILKGMESVAGRVNVEGDLTDKRMYLRVMLPDVEVAARDLLARYRAPSGAYGRDNPMVCAGFVVSNSEVGRGAYSLTPRPVVQVCRNGMTITRDGIRKIHAGGRLDEGVVEWSAETLRRNLDLITSMTSDAVRKFLSPEYLNRKVIELSQQADTPITDPDKTLRVVAKNAGFTKEQGDAIMNAFISGADLTAGGVMHAVTATAHQMDGDTAYDFESKAITAMDAAARLSRTATTAG